jgi:hypothetical protein
MRSLCEVQGWRTIGSLSVFAAAMGIGACGDGSEDGLTPASAWHPVGVDASAGGPGGSGSGGGTGSSSGGSQGGSASRDGSTLQASPDGGAVPPLDGGALGSAHGKALFEALLPQLDSTCGGPCHAQGAGGAPLWLGPPDPYASAVGYKGIVVADPSTSIVMTKGRHEGPDLIDPLRSSVQGWLEAEAAALPVKPLPSVGPFAVIAGANDVDCSPAGVAGTHLTFTAAISGSDITLSKLQIVAPASTGVRVVYPIFVTVPTSGPPISDSSFSNDDQTVAAGQTAALGPGLLILTQWSAGAQMKIEFTTLAAATVADGGLPGGCKAVASFTSNAVPAIKANQCLGCHDAGGSGNAAMDLSALGANPPDDAKACAQALAQAMPANPAQSPIILAPTGRIANHPFKGASQSFVQMMETWIAAEK